MVKKEFIAEINYNKSSDVCPACSSECKKINTIINNRDIRKVEEKEVPRILQVFNF